MSVKKNLDYIIVLGAHVDGTRMTLALLERARRALLYLKENPCLLYTSDAADDVPAV